MEIDPVFFEAHTLSLERPEELMHFLGRVRFLGCGESAEAKGGFCLVVKVFDYTHGFEQKQREGGSEGSGRGTAVENGIDKGRAVVIAEAEAEAER